MEALLLSTQDGDWKGFYINGELLEEGHELNDPSFWIEVGKKYLLDGCDLKRVELNDYDNQSVCDLGCFPESSKELTGIYHKPF